MRNKRSSGCYPVGTNFYKEVHSKLEIQYKKGMLYFSFDFGWYSFCLDIAC